MFIPFTLAFIELLATEANAKDLDLFDLDVEQRQEAVLTPRKPPDGRLINLLRLIPKIVCDKRDES